MSESSFPTEPMDLNRGVDIEQVETLPDTPEGYVLRVTIEMYTFKGIWKFHRNIQTQEHIDLFRLMATYPETLSATLYFIPLIPKPPKVPDLDYLLWGDPTSD